ncbi:MAG: hypothetical protein Q9174_007164 [Haloplaca sp. 1 TL-2023]
MAKKRPAAQAGLADENPRASRSKAAIGTTTSTSNRRSLRKATQSSSVSSVNESPASDTVKASSTAKTSEQEEPSRTIPTKKTKTAKKGKARPKAKPKATLRPAKLRSRTPRTTESKSKSPAKDQPTGNPDRRESTGSSISVLILPKTIESDSDEDGYDSDGRSYWLMKAEPETRMEKGKDVKFSIDDLKSATEPEAWDARNNLRSMMKGDKAFFYHSNCKKPGIVGTMEIVQEHTTDGSAFDPEHPYFDPKSSPGKPKWCVVHVEFRRKFPEMISLKDLQVYAKPGGVLENMQVLRTSRLSVSSVSKKEWDFIHSLVETDETGGK